MPTTELALAAASNDSLVDLIGRCVHRPGCLYHLSSVLTRSRLTKWLRATQPARSRVPIWVWLSYPNGVPPRWIQLNMRALERHAPAQHFRIVVLNATTLERWLPLPAEFPRLQHAVAASDVARVGLLAKYGGMYLDADVLVTSSLMRILTLLDEYEVVAYTTPGQDCRAGVFSSNFLATRPNTRLWARAWTSLTSQLQSRCVSKRRNRVCCYDVKGAPLPTCRSPWGLTDHVMRPVAMELAAESTLSAHCLGHYEGLTPMAFAHPAHFTLAEQACVNWLHVYTTPLHVGSSALVRRSQDRVPEAVSNTSIRAASGGHSTSTGRMPLGITQLAATDGDQATT